MGAKQRVKCAQTLERGPPLAPAEILGYRITEVQQVNLIEIQNEELEALSRYFGGFKESCITVFSW